MRSRSRRLCTSVVPGLALPVPRARMARGEGAPEFMAEALASVLAQRSSHRSTSPQLETRNVVKLRHRIR